MVKIRTLMVLVLGAIVVGLPVLSPMLRAKTGPTNDLQSVLAREASCR